MERKSEHSGSGGRKSGGQQHHNNSANTNNTSGSGNRENSANNNTNSQSQQLAAAAAAAALANEPNLAELFAAHNLLASTGMGPGGPGAGSNNPLALFQQQMNMQYANPAAWWYLEYLSRIQAAQMVPNLQTGSGSNNPERSGSGGTSGRERGESRNERENNRNSGGGTELKKNDKRNSESSTSHHHSNLQLPQTNKITRPPSRKSDKDASGHGHTNSRPGSRRGRIPGTSAASTSLSNHLTTNNLQQHLNLQQLQQQAIPATTTNRHNVVHNERDHNPPAPLNSQALNLSKTTPVKPSSSQQLQSSSSTTTTDPSSKSLNLPSSVTIIPHAHSKPDSLTCPRFPSDYIPKPAHAAITTLYSHPIPKSPQVGLVKSDKGKRKSTVASLLQQSRAGGGGVDILPKNDKIIVEKSISKGTEEYREKPLKLDKRDRDRSNVSPGPGRQTPESRNQSSTQNTPPHRPWLNSTAGGGIAPTTELNIPQIQPKSTTKQEPDLNLPLANGWKRETLLKSLSANGLNGDVSYISPSNITVKSMQELKKLVGNNGLKNYSFSSKLLIGDFLVPNDEGVLKLTSDELANWLKEEARQNKKEEERIKRERERKKEHAGYVRSLEAYRRSKRRYKQQQERKQRKREALEPEIKQPEPVEIDELLTDKKLPTLQEIIGLKLSPQAFANLLHIYEFLHTFGNTLGFDMDSLPTLSNLQKAFLHIDESEEELLSVLSHLLVCAVEDPGMPNPNKHMTAFGQTLKQADITFGSLSEVLRLYLTAVSDSEPEAEKFSEWLNEAPFLALSPTRKSTIISFICDLLLQNKAVLKHLETSTETAHTARKDRQQYEIKIRKLRMLSARKTVAAVAVAPADAEAETDNNAQDDEEDIQIKKEIEDSELSNHKLEQSSVKLENEEPDIKSEVQIKHEPEDQESRIEESADSVDPLKETTSSKQHDLESPFSESKPSTEIIYIKPPPPPPDADDVSTYLSSSSSSEESDSDSKLTNDEVRCKINTLQKTADKLKILQSSSMRVIRSSCLGQDRYRRRFWNLPAAGGLYIEGGQSGEFEDLKALVNEKLKYSEPHESDDHDQPVLNGESHKATEESVKIEEAESVENDEDEKMKTKVLSDSPSPTFQVPPPCIKIFGFNPREGCSGKVKPLPSKPEPSDEDYFLSIIREKYWNGWWKLEGSPVIEEFIQELCQTGIREAHLKTALQNLPSPPALAEDEFDDDEIATQVQSPENGWDPELAFKVHQQLLETLETLEERVASASLQVKGWQLPPKPEENLTEEEIIQIVKDRLLDLESAVERRYLKPPLGKSAHELNLANLTDGGGENYVGPRALTHWRDAISKATTPSVLSMAIYSLDSSIAWDKSVMKASCQLCKGGDNEDQLLLCDACDRGYHTYCFKPPLETIPEGDWFCWECINKATGVKGCIVCGKGGGKLLACDKCVKAFHIDCINPPLPKVPRGRWHCPDHKSQTKKRKSDSQGTESPGPSAKKSAKKSKSEMAQCEKLLDDLSKHEDAWPFLEPVNTRQFPTYKKIIKNPIDLATIRSRMPTYKNKLEFLTDIRLIFDNCLTFNEDDSPVGKAGHNLRLFFEAGSSKF